MCGRYTLVVDSGELWEQLGLEGEPEPIPARYNLAPTQDAAVVGLREGAQRPRLVHMRWGLVPSWAEDMKVGARMINARSETAAKKPAFRRALAQRRCLVPASGFYEWKTEDKKKQPYLITLEDDPLFTFAGLWERWLTPTRERLFSFTILTTEAAPALTSVHHRMPVIVPVAQRETWLRGEAPGESTLRALVEAPVPAFALKRVSTHVSSARNDDARCLEPLV